ncbi:MAG: GNAT family N-acetyltransferase [Spirochaetales bacterium]|nr:GNAT family N-acetyltransferase [Spirochaetales bacterium]
MSNKKQSITPEDKSPVRTARASDAPGICEIYNYYISHTRISFEEQPVSVKEMEERIGKVQQKFCWIVWEEDGEIAGYAYASPWRVRSAYRYSVESTVYVHRDHHGRGIGSRLYRALLKDLEAREVRKVIAGITQPNEKSVRLHESLGFVKCALFTDVGYKMGEWADVGYWEKSLPGPAGLNKDDEETT